MWRKIALEPKSVIWENGVYELDSVLVVNMKFAKKNSKKVHSIEIYNALHTTYFNGILEWGDNRRENRVDNIFLLYFFAH